MQGNTSKYRNVYGEASKGRYEDVKMSETMSDGSLIDVNSQYIALSWKTTTGGNVAVFDSTNFFRLPVNLPVITGHQAPVVDVKFSPFRSNLLATSSEDSSVRLWEIPQGGVCDDVVEQQKFTGHSRKVGVLSFSPVVEELIASASVDNTVNMWNILSGSSHSRISISDVIFSLDWNHNSSLIGCSSKNKNVCILDPRANAITLQTEAYDSFKTHKMRFLNENFLMTTGFNKKNERVIKLFDIRNFTECTQAITIDSLSGVISPFYDTDSGLIFLVGRGEGNMKYYDFSNSTLKFANEFRSPNHQKATAMFPKRTMDYNKNEVARFAKSCGTYVEYVSFIYPKKNEGYDSSVTSEVFAGEPALGLEEWLKGENREPVRKDITTMENSYVTKVMSFEKKVHVEEEEKKSDSHQVHEAKIAQLEAIVKEQQHKIDALSLELNELHHNLEATVAENNQLKCLVEKMQAENHATTENTDHEVVHQEQKEEQENTQEA